MRRKISARYGAKLGRRPFLKVVGLVALAAVLPSGSAVGQSALPVVGFVSPQSRDAQALQIDAFLRGMEELGYVEGETVRYEWRFADGDRDLRVPLLAEVVALQPDVIVTPPAMSAYGDVNQTVPWVIANMSTDVLNAAMALPNTNITGTTRSPDTPGIPERLALAVELAPANATIGYLLCTCNDDGGVEERAEAEAAASAVGATLLVGTAANLEEIPAAAQTLVDQGVALIVYGGGGIFATGRIDFQAVVEAAGIPAIYGARASTTDGGLISLGTNNDVTFYGAAALVDQILRGVAPADIPYAEFPTAWLAVNLPAAARIGFAFPQAILDRANEVIQ